LAFAAFGEKPTGAMKPHERKTRQRAAFGVLSQTATHEREADTGTAARFFAALKHEPCYDVSNEIEDEAWLASSLNLDPATIAALCSCRPSVLDAFALGRVLSGVLPEGLCFATRFLGHTTSATPSGLRRLCESVIEAIQSIERAYWLGLPPESIIQTRSRASCAVSREQTGITTITVDHWKSDGSAGAVTFGIMPTSMALGDPAFLRFSYAAKASRSERGGSMHPTVKPLALMRYLVRLVTPPGGTVLDPFTGSGTTMLAADAEGLQCIGAEREHIDDVAMRWGKR
jgi:hypothetical protein